MNMWGEGVCMKGLFHPAPTYWVARLAIHIRRHCILSGVAQICKLVWERAMSMACGGRSRRDAAGQVDFECADLHSCFSLAFGFEPLLYIGKISKATYQIPILDRLFASSYTRLLQLLFGALIQAQGNGMRVLRPRSTKDDGNQ